MIPAALIPSVLGLLGRAWPFLMAGGVGAAVWVFAVMPLKADLRAVERDLSSERAAHLYTSQRLQAETDGRLAANELVFLASQQNAALATELDVARAERDAARQSAVEAANTELNDAPSDFDRMPVPALDGWRVCRDAARILGTAVNQACGSPPAADR